MSEIYPSLFVIVVNLLLSNDVVQADDIQNEANELLRIRDYLFKELAQKTGQPVGQVRYCYFLVGVRSWMCVFELFVWY